MSSQVQDLNSSKSAAEALYRTLVHNLPNGIVALLDHDLRILIVEGRGLAKLSLTKDSIEGKTIAEILPGKTYQQIEPGYRAALSGHANVHTVSFEGRLYRTQVAPVRDIKGRVAYVMSMSEDITEQTQTVNCLKESEERYRTLVENLPDVFYITDLQLNMLYANPALKRQTGLTVADFREAKKATTLVYPEDQARVARFIRNFLEDKYERSDIIEYRFLDKGGKVHWFSSRIAKVTFQGQLALQFVCRNVTLQKHAEKSLTESEERYRMLIEHASDGILISDSHGNFVDVNTSSCQMLQYDSSELLRMNFGDIIHREDALVDPSFFQSLEQRATALKERRLKRKDGSYLYVEMNLKRMEDQSIQAIVRDISERKAADAKIRYRLEFENLVLSISNRFIHMPVNQVDQGIEKALFEIKRFFTTDVAYLFQFSYDNSTISMTHCARDKAPQKYKKGAQDMPCDDILWWTDQLLNNRVVAIASLDELPGEALKGKNNLQARKISSLIDVPLVSNGKVIGFVGLSTVIPRKSWQDDEITLLKIVGQIFGNALQRKHADEDLRRTHEFNERLIESLQDGFAVVNPDGVHVKVNSALCKMTGFSRDELIGTAPPYPYWPEEERDKIKTAFQETLSNNFQNQEMIFKRKNGERFPVMVSPNGVQDDDGHIEAYFATMKDITELKRKEQAIREKEESLRSVVETAPNFIGTMNRDGTILFMNRTLPEYTPEQVIGMSTFDFTPTEYHDTLRTALNYVFETGEIYEYETRGTGPDGSTSWYLSRLGPIKKDNKVVAVTVCSTDITERRQNQQEIHKLNAELEQRVSRRTAELEAVNRELESFAYSVSHDLRAPLRGIDGFSLTLLEDYGSVLDEQGKHFLNRLRSASQRMGELIDNLLELSRITRSQMHRVDVNLSQVAQKIVRELKEREPKRKVKFEIQKNLIATGDKFLLRIALTNLMWNAWKFTGGRKKAKIEFGSYDSPDGVTFFVRDNGAGFDMTYAGKLFGPFQRLHGQEEFEGTGIGLATVQRIINRHGGKIWAESETNKGATFFFRISAGKP